MCSAPIGSIPPPIGMLELGIGIELDISGIGDELWPPAATADDEWPEPHAAASSASAPTPTATLKINPGRDRPGGGDLNMDRPPQASAPGKPAPGKDVITDGFQDASIGPPAPALIAHPPLGAGGLGPGRDAARPNPPAGHGQPACPPRG